MQQHIVTAVCPFTALTTRFAVQHEAQVPLLVDFLVELGFAVNHYVDEQISQDQAEVERKQIIMECYSTYLKRRLH